MNPDFYDQWLKLAMSMPSALSSEEKEELDQLSNKLVEYKKANPSWSAATTIKPLKNSIGALLAAKKGK